MHVGEGLTMSDHACRLRVGGSLLKLVNHRKGQYPTTQGNSIHGLDNKGCGVAQVPDGISTRRPYKEELLTSVD